VPQEASLTALANDYHVAFVSEHAR
jgi:hypothetical protein